ncbi:MAG: response regulator transcription factor [Pleomorphochaeta sp.]
MKYKIIIVEDEKIELQELSMIINNLKDLNIELIGTAENGIDGQKIINDLCPDIVISDIRLPGQTGLDMLNKIVPQVKSIILSGYSDFKLMQNAIRLGVNDYLLKPLDDKDLVKALSKIIESLDTEKDNNDTTYIKIPKTDDIPNHLINNAVKYIQNNYNTPIGLQEAAHFLNVSETHLSRLFKELVGINFLTYLNTYRINKSIDLLLNSTDNINNIAYKCGYITPGYYAKIFKRLLNTTPTQFRDNN